MKAGTEDREIYESQAERRARQRYRRRVTIGQIALIVSVIAFWHFGSGRLFDPFFVGNPVAVAKVLINDLGDPGFYNDLRVTGIEMTLGYFLGALSGIALGVLFARWRLAADIFDPFFTGLNSLPRIALAPLLVIWFGIDMASKVVLAATLVFFLTFLTTLTGIRNVDPALVDVARLVGASERQIFRYVMLPGAAAWVINGLKMSLPYALIGVIVGEFLVASSGLGYRLNFYSTSYNTNGTFAMLLVMMALMMALNALMGLLERYALRWQAESTQPIPGY
jgi:NitT/TauT family transport system permease protein